MTDYLDLADGFYPDWHRAALCHPDHGHDPATWFPVTPPGMPGGERARARVAAPALAICKRCPALAKCAEFARTNRVDSGIWAGIDYEGVTKGSHDAA